MICERWGISFAAGRRSVVDLIGDEILELLLLKLRLARLLGCVVGIRDTLLHGRLSFIASTYWLGLRHEQLLRSTHHIRIVGDEGRIQH